MLTDSSTSPSKRVLLIVVLFNIWNGAAEQESSVETQLRDADKRATMSLTNLKGHIWLSFDLDHLFDDSKLTPFTIDFIMGASLIELLLP